MKTIKLLLIEDEVNMGYIIKNGMEIMIGGYEVCVAVNGEEGLKQLETFNPDVVVSDIEMPCMSGLEVVRKIRQTNLDIPILFATGKTMPNDVTAGLDAGADNYIKKPFMPEELDAHIKTVINLKNNSRLKLKNAIRKIGLYTYDPKNFALIYNDTKKKVLTAKESYILALLLEHKGEIVKRNDILEKFWKHHDSVFASRCLDRFITQLRKYLSKDDSVSIKNIKGEGLILDF